MEGMFSDNAPAVGVTYAGSFKGMIDPIMSYKQRLQKALYVFQFYWSRGVGESLEKQGPR